MTENEFENTADANRPDESIADKAKAQAERARESAAQAAGKVKDSAANARDYTAERYQAAKDYSRERYDDARAYSRQRWDDARHGAQDARQKAAEGIDSNPLAAAGLGLIAGMAIGFLLPRTRQESKLVGGYRDDLMDQATAAAKAARDTGEKELRSIADQAKVQAKGLSEQAVDAAKKAGDAGAREAKLKS